MSDRGVLAVSAELRTRGLDVVRFNFPYTERNSRRPDASLGMFQNQRCRQAPNETKNECADARSHPTEAG